MNIAKSKIKLYASAKAVIAQFLHLPGSNRVSNVIKRVEEMQDSNADECLQKLMKEFAGRHRNIEQVFLNHFATVEKQYGKSLLYLSDKKQLLLGAFFTKEYSIQAAALFNPSIVPHPDQQGLKPGEQRFVMSLRATGEGHISSIVFQTGIVNDKAEIMLDMSQDHFTCLPKNIVNSYHKNFVSKCAASFSGFNKAVMDIFPDTFTAAEAAAVLSSVALKDKLLTDSVLIVQKIIDTNYELEALPGLPINEKVIFPNAKAESMGMEDVRFVHFKDGNDECYYGTYTAYNGKEIKTQLIETKDFSVFKIKSLYGKAIADKGMALFPEKVNGKYAMISRQGGEKISIMFSDDLYWWDEFETLMEPKYSWELVQLGNCGSPIKTDKGWLLLTHGVGVMRTYVISAILLDINNPAKIIGRLNKPLIEADETEREGYVPNVIYTCGFMRHGNLLIIPYAVSDSATGFVSMALDELLNEMIH